MVSTWLWTRITWRATSIFIHRKTMPGRMLGWILERQTEVKAKVWESTKVPERTLIRLYCRGINNFLQSISIRTAIIRKISCTTINNWATILSEWAPWVQTPGAMKILRINIKMTSNSSTTFRISKLVEINQWTCSKPAASTIWCRGTKSITVSIKRNSGQRSRSPPRGNPPYCSWTIWPIKINMVEITWMNLINRLT